MTTFKELLLAEVESIQLGEAIATMPITDSHLNTYRICLGGFMASLAQMAAEEAAGSNTHQISLDYRFLRPAPSGSLAQAHATLAKRGNTFLTVETRVFAGDTLVGLALSDHVFNSVDVASQTHSPHSPAQLPPLDFFFNTKDRAPIEGNGDSTRRILACTDRSHLPKDLNFGSSVHAGLHINRHLLHEDGAIPLGVLCHLADNAFGTVAFSHLGRDMSAVTTGLRVDCPQKIEKAETLSCTARLAMRSGRLMSFTGELWTKNEQAGTCSATFFVV